MRVSEFEKLLVTETDLSSWSDEGASFSWNIPHVSDLLPWRIGFFVALCVILGTIFKPEENPVFVSSIGVVLICIGFCVFGLIGGFFLSKLLRRRYKILTHLLGEVSGYNRSLKSLIKRLRLSNELSKIGYEDEPALKESEVLAAFRTARNRIQSAIQVDAKFRNSGVDRNYRVDLSGILASGNAITDGKVESFSSEFEEAVRIGLRTEKLLKQIDRGS